MNNRSDRKDECLEVDGNNYFFNPINHVFLDN